MSTPSRLRGLLKTRLLHNIERSSLTLTGHHNRCFLVPERRRHWKPREKKESVWHRTGSVTATDDTSHFVHDVVMKCGTEETKRESDKGTVPPFALLACWDTGVNNVLAWWPSGLEKRLGRNAQVTRKLQNRSVPFNCVSRSLRALFIMRETTALNNKTQVELQISL